MWLFCLSDIDGDAVRAYLQPQTSGLKACGCKTKGSSAEDRRTGLDGTTPTCRDTPRCVMSVRWSPHLEPGDSGIKRENHVALNLTRSKLFTSSLPLTSRHTPVWRGGSESYGHRLRQIKSELWINVTNHNAGWTPSPPVIGPRRGWGGNPFFPVVLLKRGRCITKSNGHLFGSWRRRGVSRRTAVGF